MSFVGRIIAGARDLSLGGPLGNLLAGAASLIPSWLPPHGQGEDASRDPRRRIAFTIAVIALGAKMAKADGAVTRDEVAAFGEVFQVPAGEEEHVRLVFDLARRKIPDGPAPVALPGPPLELRPPFCRAVPGTFGRFASLT